MKFFIRAFIMLIFCIPLMVKGGNFEDDVHNTLRQTITATSPTSPKTVSTFPSLEATPLHFSVNIRHVTRVYDRRFFDTETDLERHELYRIGLIFKGENPEFMAAPKKTRVAGQPLGFLDITVIREKETQNTVGYLDEINFETEFHGLGLGSIAITVFTRFMDTLGCSTSYLKLLSHEPHTCGLYERHGYVFTARSLEKLDAVGVDLYTFQKNSSAAGSLPISPLRMVRSSVSRAASAAPTSLDLINTKVASPDTPLRRKKITADHFAAVPSAVPHIPRPLFSEVDNSEDDNLSAAIRTLDISLKQQRTPPSALPPLAAPFIPRSSRQLFSDVAGLADDTDEENSFPFGGLDADEVDQS